MEEARKKYISDNQEFRKTKIEDLFGSSLG
jgi:hypothetical protein